MPKRNLCIGLLLLAASGAFAGDADIQLPALDQVSFVHGAVTSHAILFFGLFVCAVGAAFGLWEYTRTRALPVHKSMREVSHIIWETCKTYLWQQGKFLAAIWALIAVCMIYYFSGLQHKPFTEVLVILSDLMLRMGPAMILLHMGMVAILCFGLSGISVGLGARLPNLKEDDP